MSIPLAAQIETGQPSGRVPHEELALAGINEAILTLDETRLVRTLRALAEGRTDTAGYADTETDPLRRAIGERDLFYDLGI
ncbi:MAG: hypothetical protein KGL39_54855, partial [Patescibacteria group bacterium]|nr:hypothetical protein [Patescibacteria group bacterium]